MKCLQSRLPQAVSLLTLSKIQTSEHAVTLTGLTCQSSMLKGGRDRACW
jgi:hypothetical protein